MAMTAYPDTHRVCTHLFSHRQAKERRELMPHGNPRQNDASRLHTLHPDMTKTTTKPLIIKRIKTTIQHSFSDNRTARLPELSRARNTNNFSVQRTHVAHRNTSHRAGAQPKPLTTAKVLELHGNPEHGRPPGTD